MTNAVLADRYHKACNTPSDIVEHLPTFVAAVKELNATKVVELGVRYGLSTLAWLYALEGSGHLWSVDCSFPVAGPEFPDTNLLDPQGPLGVVEWWTFILGYDTWPAVLDSLPTEVDLVFIDTQHTYELTTQELELYYPRVRSGGRILLHDTDLRETGNATTSQPLYPVLTAMKEFCEKRDLKWENNPRCSGLGTVFC